MDQNRKCAKRFQERDIGHKREHSSRVAAVQKIDDDLRDRLTGQRYELIQNPPQYDLAP